MLNERWHKNLDQFNVKVVKVLDFHVWMLNNVFPLQMYHADGPRMEGAFRKIFHRPMRNSQSKRTHELYVGHGNIFRFFILRSEFTN